MANSELSNSSANAMQRPTESDMQQLNEQVEMILAEAKKQGATAAEVNLGVAQGLSVGVRLGEVETLEFHRSQGVSLTVYSGQRSGSASSSDTSKQSIKETVAAALNIAKYTGEDPASGLAPQELLADVNNLPELDLYHPWDLTPERGIEIATAIENAGRQDARIVNSDGANVVSGISSKAYGNSHGFIASYNSSGHSLSCVLVAEQDGSMQRDAYFHSHRSADKLFSGEYIGEEAARRTIARLGAQQPKTGKWPIIFSPEIAKKLFSSFFSAISGGALYRKSTFLLDRLNTQVFPEWLTFGEHPHLRQGPSSAPFDSDAIATAQKDFVQNGQLASYALSLYSARRLNRQPTGNGGGVRNVLIPEGDQSLAELCQQMGTGILVTEVMGQGVNLLTGDYSRGAAGFWVEDGVISHPIEEFTIAGNLNDMFLGIQAIGNDVDRRSGIQTGSVLLAPMMVAGS